VQYCKLQFCLRSSTSASAPSGTANSFILCFIWPDYGESFSVLLLHSSVLSS